MIVNLTNAPSSAEASAQASRISKDAPTGQASKAAGAGSYTEDTTSLTSASDSVKDLTATALATDPARAARVQSLKQAVSLGQYAIEPEQVASALASAKV